MRRVDIPWKNAIVLAMSDGAPPLSGDWFSDQELVTVASFRLEKRRQEWLLSRMAAKRLAVEIGFCKSARECRVEQSAVIAPSGERMFVSLSHSGHYAAAAIDARPIGIDVQKIQHLEERAAHLFLSDEESEAMTRCVIPHRILHFWCAKEAAWKERGGVTATLKKIPLQLMVEGGASLEFESVRTLATGDLILAITFPIS